MSANIKKKKITAHFCLLNLVMINEHFERIVKEKFGFDFSPTQQAAMKNFLAFLFDRHPESLFLLKGYAGTGKTSLVAAIVNTLLQFEQQVVLLAPTGRAAKVFPVILISLLLRYIKRFTGRKMHRRESEYSTWDLTGMPTRFFSWMRHP